jgi:2-polyprenyl-3-methyl-5-hydroxy-6-metoxy-1,4-benzoquinol methylase
MELTEVKFWEDYWRDCVLPCEVDMHIPFDRCLAQALAQRLKGMSGDVFEIGCAPGKWLAFMARTFGMRASGIEYSNAGMQATVRNFKILGLPIDTIMAGDFFAVEPEPRFDVVMSYGFIEHFDDPDAVVARHAAWLKPGGTLIIGVPNFTGIYYPMQKCLDPAILDKHNLATMRPGYFHGLARRIGLDLVSMEYLASFEPSLPIAKPGRGNPAQFLLKIFLRVAAKLRRLPTLDNLNGPWISACILAIYKKPAIQ